VASVEALISFLSMPVVMDFSIAFFQKPKAAIAFSAAKDGYHRLLSTYLKWGNLLLK
jgi:hypothetical protein